MATFDSLNNIFYGICRLSFQKNDPILLELNRELKTKIILSRPDNYRISPVYKPNMYFLPKFVWEVSFETFVTSPQFDLGKGIIEEVKSIKGLSIKNIRLS